MLRRSLLTSLALLALSPAAAGAAPSDDFVPLYDADDGVFASRSERSGLVVRFAPKAAGVYRRLAGRRVRVACGETPPPPEAGDTVTFSTLTARAPRHGRSLVTGLGGRDYDVCLLSTKLARREDVCVAPTDDATGWCVRVVVAFNETGRNAIDEEARRFDIAIAYLVAYIASRRSRFPPPFPDVQRYLPNDVTELPSPDASPPLGRVGYWSDGASMTLAVVTRSGVRRFLRRDGDVLSTNLPNMPGTGLDIDAFSFF